MKTFFPDNHLPPQAQDWVFKLEREISLLKASIARAASVSQVAQVVQEVRDVQANAVSLKETVDTTQKSIPVVEAFNFNVDGGLVESNYGGIEPLDGGRP